MYRLKSSLKLALNYALFNLTQYVCFFLTADDMLLVVGRKKKMPESLKTFQVPPSSGKQ